MEYVRRELEPRDLGDLIAESFRICGRTFGHMLGIVSLVALAFLPVALLLSAFFVTLGVYIFSATHLDINNEEESDLAFLLVIVLLSVWATITCVLYCCVAFGAVIHATCQQHFRQPVSIKQAFKHAWRKAPSLTLNALIYMLVTGLLSITCIGIPLAIYLGNKWVLASQAIVIENCGPIRAFSRSSELVKDNWWRVFGIEIVFYLLTNAVSSFANAIPVLGLLAALMITCIGMAIGETLLYYDLRLRKEGFNIDTMAKELGIDTGDTGQAATP